MGTLLNCLRWLSPSAIISIPAMTEHWRDHRGLPAVDPGPDLVIDEGIAWLCRAQDCSTSHDGGVARHYSLVCGWSESYPETTGYIIPTLLAYAGTKQDESTRRRALKMADWLVSIQLPEGGFQGGMVTDRPLVPVCFNTGQILLGLAAVTQSSERGPYYDALLLAADWLVEVQDPSGYWRKHGSPFAAPGEKVYDTHIAWGLLEAERIQPGRSYGEAALLNIAWALSLQQKNGWFPKCCLTDPEQPLTHTIGYALRGIIEGYRYSGDGRLLHASRLAADGIMGALDEDGFLPGRLNAHWRGTVPWACLTGSAQIAACWMLLYQITGAHEYRKAASDANAFVRRTIRTTGRSEVRGGVKGSFPVNGGYGTYEYLNWACKFVIDANALEQQIMDEEGMSKLTAFHSEHRRIT